MKSMRVAVYDWENKIWKYNKKLLWERKREGGRDGEGDIDIGERDIE